MRTIPDSVAWLMSSDSPGRSERVRVTISDGADDWVLTDLVDGDWVLSIERSQDIDSPIQSAMLTLAREDGERSLVPLRELSELNNLLGSFVPALALSREILIEEAIVPEGDEPAPGDWMEVFRGHIHNISWEPEVTIECLDTAGQLQRAWIEDETTYGATLGRDVEDVIADILTAWGPGIWATPATSFVCPVSPAWVVREYRQDKMSIWQALQNIVAQFGWCLEYRWHEPATAWRLVLYDPERDKTTPDRTFAPSDYLEVNAIGTSLEEVRNVLAGTYGEETTPDPADEPARERIKIPDDLAASPLKTRLDTSIAEHHRLFAEIIEEAESLIDTEAKMLRLLSAAASDLCEPKVSQQVVLESFPFAQLTDLYRWGANGRHYDTDQDLAVTTIQHVHSAGSGRTLLGCRGQPASMSEGWLARTAAPGVGRTAPEQPPQLEDPVVHPIPGGLQVDTRVGEVAPRLRDRLDVFEVHIGPGDFTPSAVTLAARGRERVIDVVGERLPIGEDVHVKVVAVDRRGNRSPASAAIAGTVGRVGSQFLTGSAVSCPGIFPGGLFEDFSRG